MFEVWDGDEFMFEVYSADLAEYYIEAGYTVLNFSQ